MIVLARDLRIGRVRTLKGSRLKIQKGVTPMQRAIVNFTTTLTLLFTLFAINALAQGKFIYTNNNRKNHNSVSGFKVNPDGSINLLPGMPVPTGDGGGNPNVSKFSYDQIVTTMRGPFLFASNAESQTIA